MYYSIKGKVKRIDENVAIVENNGIGYEVVCSFSTLEDLTKDGQEKTVYTYLQVREDAMALYGFSSLEEKKMFLNLISVSGIGPKMAVTILSGVSARSLAGAVVSGNVKMLTSVKGLGKKTAERIILELREKVAESAKSQENINFDGFENIQTDVNLSREMLDAIAILTELGIKKEEATKMVKAKALQTDKADEIIRKCL